MTEKQQKIAKHAESDKPSSKEVTDFHVHADTDGSPKSIHHTTGPNANQAAAGNHTHDGGNSAVLDKLMEGITVTGVRSDGTALASLLSQLSTKFGLIDSTTP